MVDKIDIGNVRGIKGDKGEKGDRGRTPSYEDIKYQKIDDEFITLHGNGDIEHYYIDSDGNLCDENGYILDENRNSTNRLGTEPFKDAWIDEDGNFTNEKGELLDEEGNVQYVTSDFISDITRYIYDDEEGYDKIVNDIYPHITNTLINANPNDPKYKSFFDEIEGDIKYYICEDNPSTNIKLINGKIKNTCTYKDENGNLAIDGNNKPLYVPLEKNTLYLYNVQGIENNDIMHYDVYLCTKANTVPKKIISSADFTIDYNVIDEFKISLEENDEINEDELKVWLEILTRGTRGQFYSMSDVDTLFNTNLIQKLGANNGIAQLNSSGKVPSSQLPAYIDDVIEGRMNNAETTFIPSEETYIDSVKQTGTIYVDTNTRKTYRWTGSNYVNMSNPIVVDDGSTTAYASTKGDALETKIGNATLETKSKTITEAINEHETEINSLESNKQNKTDSSLTTTSKNITGAINELNNTKSPTNHKHTISDVTDLTNASKSTDGLMTKDAFNKLSGVQNGATKTVVDSALNSNSTNPVQNKVIAENVFTKDEVTSLLYNIETGRGRILTINVTEEGVLQVDNNGFEYYTSDEVDEALEGKSDISHTHDFVNTQLIKSNDDLNDYTTQGVYLCKSSSIAQSLSNSPTRMGFGMIVLQTYNLSEKTGYKQIVMNYNVADSLNSIYTRNYFDSNWSSWREIRDSNNSYSKSEVNTALNNKVDKVTGKGLSTEDFTTSYKTSLDNLDASLNSKTLTLEKQTLVNSEYAASYILKQGGVALSQEINIPKINQISFTVTDEDIANEYFSPESQEEYNHGKSSARFYNCLETDFGYDMNSVLEDKLRNSFDYYSDAGFIKFKADWGIRYFIYYYDEVFEIYENENINNKKPLINAYSTHNDYPSSKAVYEYVQSKIGNALNYINS